MSDINAGNRYEESLNKVYKDLLKTILFCSVGWILFRYI